MKKILAGVVVVCFVFSLFAVIAPHAKGTADSTNSTTNIIILPIGNGTAILSIPPSNLDSTASTFPSSNGTAGICPFKDRKAPLSTPIVRHNADGTETLDFGTLDSQNHWFSIDWWTSFGYGLPSKMNGTFRAVDNRIQGLQTGDVVQYLPMNVAYGSSIFDYVWFQFCIEFSTGGINMRIWDIKGSDYRYTDIPTDQVPYTVGDTYNFELTPSGTNTLTFWIRDVNTTAYWEKNSWHFTIPGLNMLNLEDAFSPASAVEGYTTSSQLTNVPYFMTHVGYQTPAHWHSTEYTSPPSGIGTKVWYDSNYYYWAMLSDTYMTTATGSGYGTGWVYNAAGIIGSAPNWDEAHIYGNTYGSGGNIVGDMNTIAGGEVYVYACSDTGYSSNLLVYASYDYSNWYQVGTTKTVTNQAPQWIYIGSYMPEFKYLAVVGYDTGNPVSLWADCVKVGN